MKFKFELSEIFNRKISWSFGGFGVGLWRNIYYANGHKMIIWSIALGPGILYIREMEWTPQGEVKK